MSKFNRCTNRKKSGGIYSVECKLGLWSVEGDNEKQVKSEAMYYFKQYELDGEYSSIIGGKSVVDKLLEKQQ